MTVSIQFWLPFKALPPHNATPGTSPPTMTAPSPAPSAATAAASAALHALWRDTSVGITCGVGGLVLAAAVFDSCRGGVVRPGHAARRSLRFRLRRTLNWFPVALCYAAFYFARYTLSAMNTPRFRHMMGLTQGELGWVLTSGMWTYALTGTLTGTAADRLGGKRAMLLSAAGAGLANAMLAAWFLYVEYYGDGGGGAGGGGAGGGGAGGGGAGGAHNASWNMSPLSSSSSSSSASSSAAALHNWTTHSASSSSASSFSSASSPSPSSPAHHHSSPFVAMAVLYSLSNFFQGFGTSACVKLNAGWYVRRAILV